MNEQKPDLSHYTALYSPLDQEYNQIMSGPYEDVSYHGEDCTVIAGLKDGRISGFWRPMVALGEKKALQGQIERLWSISQDITYMDFLVGGELSMVSRFLLKKGYHARACYSQVLAIDDPCWTGSIMRLYGLHSQLRKSYKSLVAKYDNVHDGTLDDYRRNHERFGGHQRPQATWTIQAKMIERNDAYVLTDGPDAAILIYDNSTTAYYAGGRSSPDKTTHALLWQAITRSEAKTFELGEQVFHVGQKMMDGKPATEKHINISHFKAGFGGETMTRLILERP